MSREQKFTLARIITAAALMLTAYLLPVEGIWRLAAFAVPYLVVGYDVVFSSVRGIFHGELFDEEFLMAIATIGAFAVGDYPEAAAVMLFYQIGELFQDCAVGRSRRSVTELMDIRPDCAHVIRDGAEITVAPAEVAVGETILIRPGERVPLDGTIIDGATTLNTAALTGESLPVAAGLSERVISGSINLTGVIRVRTESAFGESTVSKILELVENASEKKSRAEDFITRFARWYTPCVVGGAALLAVIPPLVTGQPFASWLHRALIFLVVSCPCALVVSIPLSFFGGIGGAAHDGILIKGANHLEALSKADTVVFDKTGTLTRGVFVVEAIHPSEISEAELLDITAVAESYSSHPVALSILRAHGGHIDHSRLGNVEELAGKGIRANVDGCEYFIGNTALMAEAGAQAQDCHLGGTIIHISRGDRYLGHIVVNDEIKQEAAESISDLKRLGFTRTVMLTGDSHGAAERVGSRIGIDEIHDGLLPAQKVEQVERILADGHSVVFIGDGINDAPVLARADVGIAMGAMGSDAAIESADIVLMDDKLQKLVRAVKISRRTMRIVRQNIILALAVKAVILILGALGIANMWTAVFGDVGVLILAVLNAVRALLPIKDSK